MNRGKASHIGPVEKTMSEHDNNPDSPPDPFALVAKIKSRGPAPVHLWDPPFCGDIDLVIKRDGTWMHEGKPIRRPAIQQLFASVLKREGDKYFLVTPVEKVGIQVEDCPFVIIAMEEEQVEIGPCLHFETNTGELVVAGPDHRLLFEQGEGDEPHPILHVRDGLWGLLSRAVFYRLVELAVTEPGGESARMGIVSAGEFFPLEAAP